MRFTHYAMLAAIALGMALPTTVHARVNNHYAQWKLGQPYGYRVKSLGPNRWRVRGLGFHAPSGFVSAMVLHRAAMLAKASGFSYFASESFKVTCGSGGGAYWWWWEGADACHEGIRDHEANLFITGTENAAGAVLCEMGGQPAANCQLYAVADVLRYTAPVLGLTAEEEARELSEISLRSSEK